MPNSPARMPLTPPATITAKTSQFVSPHDKLSPISVPSRPLPGGGYDAADSARIPHRESTEIRHGQQGTARQPREAQAEEGEAETRSARLHLLRRHYKERRGEERPRLELSLPGGEPNTTTLTQSTPPTAAYPASGWASVAIGRHQIAPPLFHRIRRVFADGALWWAD